MLHKKTKAVVAVLMDYFQVGADIAAEFKSITGQEKQKDHEISKEIKQRKRKAGFK